ncbi:MAG TPA: TonB-dependent receptor plug domain-containing protein [Bryobacteraceae bacterium]|nr:TonB-dependent receptor plug domain-containing protein [Bryobacteraceae bacterium]
MPGTTDQSGYYVFTNLLPGYYSISADASGFKKFQSIHNKLDANTTLTLNAALAIGAATETVEVTSSASVLQTESGAVQSVVSEQQIQSQELNGRNPLYMASLLPGIRSSSTLGDFNFSLTNGGYNINGTRQQDTMITTDGAPATRTRGNSTSIGVPDVDSTQEVQVLTGDYAPEYGDTAGGQIRIVTKSGTTAFHGSAFEYFRNSAMDANTWTRNLSKSTDFASPFRYNDFGFNVGGPVEIPKVWEKWKEKFLFFVAQEWTRYRFTDTQTQAVPTDLMRQGNFSELLGPNPWYSNKQIVNPATGVPFQNNIIPASMLSPNGLAILNAYPAPTPGYLNGTQNWLAQAAHPINQRKGVYNGDILPNDKNHIELRRTDFSYFEYQPFDQGSGLTGKYFKRPNQTNTVAWTYTINPTMINEVRATLSVDDVYIPVNTALPGFDRSALGIDFPYIFPQGKDITNKIPTVAVPTFYGLAGGPYPSHSQGPIYTLSDSLTKVVGNHTFKAGAYFERSGENDRDQINVSTVPGGASNQNGNFTFTDDKSGVGLANLALGQADAYTEIGPRAYTIWRGMTYEFFAQDSWKVTDKLHIDYGIRDSIITPFRALWGNEDYFDPVLYNPAQAVQVNPATGNVQLGTGNQYNGLVIPGYSQFPSSAAAHGVQAATVSTYNSLFDPNLSKYYVNIQNAIQPRLGIAYQVNSKIVLRVGAGRFVTRMNLLDNVFPGGNTPFQPFVTVNNVSVDNPGAALSSTVAAPLTVTTLDKNLKMPETYNWNATVQAQMPWKSVLSVAYVANRGTHEWNVYDINQPTVGALLANPGVNVNALRPYKGYASIQEEKSGVNSDYRSMQISWQRRFANDFSFTAAYTLSSAQDGGSNYRDIVPDSYNTSNLWGPSEFDTRNAFTAAYTYDIPIFRGQHGLAGSLLGGWELNGTIQAQTGTPCGIGSNNDYADVGEYGSFGCGNEGQFWVLNGGTVPIIGGFAGPQGTGSKYFATTTSNGTPLFTVPTTGTFNLQTGVRDEIYGPGFQNWNLGLFKKFAINERTGFEFRAEAYNFINHSNWAAIGATGGLNLNPTSSQFGEVTNKSTTNPRQLQLSLRYFF